MGYTTEFEGTLKFKEPLTAEQELYLRTFLQEDGRDHPEWINNSKEIITYIDFEISNGGLEWDGSEKSYDMVEKVNLLLDNMRVKFPEFGLQGSLRAQGEEIGDLWDLIIVNGKAERKILPKPEDLVTCPHCDEEFRMGDAS